MYRILLIFMVLLPFVSLRAVTYIGGDAFRGAFSNSYLSTLNRTYVLYISSLYACMRGTRDITEIIIGDIIRVGS